MNVDPPPINLIKSSQISQEVLLVHQNVYPCQMMHAASHQQTGMHPKQTPKLHKKKASYP